ncbi:hypothetical protein Tco_0634471 [Tanacetum coccineum]
MAALESCPTHNMVAYLEKTEGSALFHEIVDFLSRSSIFYALTVSPKVSTSLIEQFWNSVVSQTVNNVSQIKATVSGKAVSIFEASIRSDLLFNDVDGIGYRKFNFSKMIFEGMLRNLDAKKKFLMYPRFVQVFLNNLLSNLPAPLDNFPIPVLTKKVFTNMARKSAKFSGNITPLFPNMLTQAVADEGEGGHTSDRAEGGMNLEELFVLCTNLSNRVLALESIKYAQAAKILTLKARIKKLKKRCKLNILHHRAWLKSVKRLSMKNMLGKKESVSKQGRKNAKPGPTLDAFDDLDADGMDYIETKDVVKEGRQSNETEVFKLTTDTEEIAKEKGSGEKGGSTEELVSTAIPETISTARPDVSTDVLEVSTATPMTPPTTTSIFDDEDITMAQTLIKMKEEKAKEKGVSIKDTKDSSRPARSVLTLKPLPTIDPKDKGKGVLEEPEPAKKMTKSDFDAAQIARDAEISRQLEVDLQAEVERERQKEEEASKAAIAEMYDEVQAGIDADALFTAKLQQEEREEYTIKERAKFLTETIDAQRKFRAAQRSAEIRSRPPTKSQLRNLMMTYLKNIGGYKHSQLKTKSFEDIQGMYERQKKIVDNFKPMDSDDAIKDSKKAADDDTSKKEEVLQEPDSTKVEVKQEGHAESTRKRTGRRLKMKATKKSKRQKTDSDLEEEEQLKDFLMIVPDKEGEIDYEVLDKRADGSSRWIKTFSEMVTRFDRMDLEELYNLVMQRFETTTPEGIDLILWGSLRTMFKANADDDLWKNQEEWILKSWNLYDNCRVHILMLEDGTEFYMLAERRCPLTKETLKRMLALRFIAEFESEAAFELLRFIQNQIDKSGSHDGGENEL